MGSLLKGVIHLVLVYQELHSQASVRIVLMQALRLVGLEMDLV